MLAKCSQVFGYYTKTDEQESYFAYTLVLNLLNVLNKTAAFCFFRFGWITWIKWPALNFEIIFFFNYHPLEYILKSCDDCSAIPKTLCLKATPTESHGYRWHLTNQHNRAVWFIHRRRRNSCPDNCRYTRVAWPFGKWIHLLVILHISPITNRNELLHREPSNRWPVTNGNLGVLDCVRDSTSQSPPNHG